MNSFSFDAGAAGRHSTQRSERHVRSVGDTVTIENVDRFRFQDGKYGPFLKFNIKVLGGEWLYCQVNWDDNGQSIMKYLMEQAFGKVLVKKSTSEANFLSLLNIETPDKQGKMIPRKAQMNGTFEVTLKRRNVSENEGRQYTNWYVWINRDESPLEDDRRQRWIDGDIERNGSSEDIPSEDSGPETSDFPVVD